jgi:hypothetical protein
MWTRFCACNGARTFCRRHCRLGGDDGLDCVAGWCSHDTRLAQVLGVGQILLSFLPDADPYINKSEIGSPIRLPDGCQILAADDSPLARRMIEKSLAAVKLPFTMTKTGKEVGEYLQVVADNCQAWKCRKWMLYRKPNGQGRRAL